MSDVIARLRASKLEGEDESYRLGREAGRRWAEHVASYHELDRAHSFETDQLGGSPEDDAFSLALYLQGVVVEDTTPDDRKEMVERFWERVVSGGLQALFSMGDRFLEGFIDGASVVWEEVADKL